MSKVIRIDDEVWASLEERTQGFGDNPNAVIRRILGLEKENTSIPSYGTKEDTMDDRVDKLLDLVSGFGGQHPPVRPTRNGRFGIPSEVGKTFGHISPQKRRLKVRIRKDWAERVGLNDWDHELPNGWFNTGISSVYWYVPDGDEDKYRRVARIIARLLKLDA